MASAAADPRSSPPPVLSVASRSLDLVGARPPVPPTPLVGRHAEIAALLAILTRPEVRLLTLTGPGGVGKTRLAIRTAEEIGPGFADGVAFVPLAAVATPELVPPTVLRTLGGREAGEPAAERLPRLIGDRSLLLVLDNLEHVLPAVPILADLLATCPGLTIVATSRAPLRLSGEHVFPVPPLSLPAAGREVSLAAAETQRSDAVLLFVQRAQSTRPEFALATENAAAVAELCHLLDGLPLAIELAAARVGHLSPAAMTARLRRPGAARLPLLTGGARDLPGRLQTMRGAIAWSYDLLAEGERTRFRRLAVFAGGFTLDAAAAVCAADEWTTLDSIGSLVAEGLLREEPAAGHEPRFAMLETIREFGLEQLAASGEEATVRAAHAAWCIT